MTTQYAEEQGFKKKYLAPLIVLMLCAVSLTGAAYAYSTTVNGNGDISGDYYSIDMYDTDDNVISKNIKFGTDGDFEVETAKTVGQKYTAKTINAAGENSDIELVYTLKTVVQSNKSGEACKITGTIAYTHQTGSGDFYKAWDTEGTKPTCKIEISEDNTTYASAEDFAAKTGTDYYVKITVTLPAISKELSSDSPDIIKTELAFNGTGCLAISLKATNA